MSSSKLFIEPLTFEKIAEDIKIGNPASWEHNITKYIYDKVPYIAKYNTIIQIDKKDNNLGYAYGKVIVQNQINIPIIIKNKNGESVMSSFDVFNYNDKWFPLTQKRIDEILYNGNTFDRIAKPGEQIKDNGSSSNIPSGAPDTGREIIAFNRNPLNAILPFAKKADVEAVLNEVSNDKSIQAGFKVNGTFDRIEKIASRLKENFDVEIYDELGVNIVEIEKVGSLKYKTTIISDESYKPKVVTMSANSVRRIFGDEALKTASTIGYYIEEKDRNNIVPVLENDLGKEYEDVSSSGFYSVKTAMHKDEVGYVFNNVIDFNMKPLPKKIFSNGEKFAYVENVVGLNELVKKAELEHDELSPNSFGCFVFNKTGSSPIATKPFTVSPVMIKTADGIKVKISPIDGEDINIIYTDKIRTIMEKNGNYYIPSTMKFVKLGDNRISLKTKLKDVVKIAKLEKMGNKLTIRHGGTDFYMSGMDDISKFTKTGYLNKHEAIGALVKLGASINDSNRVLKEAQKRGVVNVYGFRKLNTITKTSSKIENQLADALRTNTVKLASALTDEDSVDTVLSLNFITPENVKMFTEYIPTLEEACSNLASLLVSIRIGLKNIDEYAVESAMTTLEKVTQNLKDIFSVRDALKGIDQAPGK